MSRPDTTICLSERERVYVRMMGEIEHGLNSALVEPLTKGEVARKIGRHKSFVTRKLSGVDNMTLKSLADLAWAMGRRIKIEIVPLRKERR